MHYTTHTTNLEMNRRVSEHIEKYDTLLEIIKKRKHRWLGHVLRARDPGIHRLAGKEPWDTPSCWEGTLGYTVLLGRNPGIHRLAGKEPWDTYSVLLGKVEGNITRRASKTVVGRCKGMDHGEGQQDSGWTM